MNKVVLKYQVPQPKSSGYVGIKLPEHSQPLHFGFDGRGILCLWALCSVDAARAFNLEDRFEEKAFWFYNTGREIVDSKVHVQTIIDRRGVGAVVWHIFERKPEMPTTMPLGSDAWPV